MQKDPTSIFADPAAFEAYYTRTAERLRARWEARVGFLRNGVERLQSLYRAAEAVQDDELALDIMGKVEVAEQELEELESMSQSAPVDLAAG